MQDYTKRQVIKYYFDHLYSKGTRVFLMGLLIGTICFVVSVSALVMALDATDGDNFLRIAWRSTARIMDPGDLENDRIGLIGLAMLSMTVFGVFVFGTVVSIINQAMTQKVINIQKGKSAVIEKNHVVILGWSELIFHIISELIRGKEDHSTLVIAIMANKDKVEMEEIIRQRLGKLKRLKVVCRTGNLLQPMDQMLMNIPKARSVIILPYNNEDGDMACIKTLLAMKNYLPDCPPQLSIVTALTRTHSLRLAEIVFPTISCIDLGDIEGKIIAHTSLQPGLSAVYRELLDFAGSEFYYTDKFSGLAGKSFGAIMNYFEQSVLVGIMTTEGQTLLNPNMDRIYQEGEQLLFISESKSSIEMRPMISDLTDWNSIHIGHSKLKTQSILILGWNWRSKWVMEELNLFVPDKAKVTVYTDHNNEYTNEISRTNIKCSNLLIEHVIADLTDRVFLDSIDYDLYDHIILLSCCNPCTREHADAKSLATILHLRDIMDSRKLLHNIIIELEDDRNRELLCSYKIDDVVICDFYSALLMTQVSENRHLLPMFRELFSSEGSEIYIKPADDYVSSERAVNFYTVQEAAKQKHEVAIGYKIANDPSKPSERGRIVINPNKSEAIHYSSLDSIIVIAQEY